MDYRQLQRTSLTTSRVVLGTMTFGDQTDQTTATAMVDAALDAGINHFDCANSYTAGAAEEVLGKALGTRRDDVILTTKAFNPVGGDRGLSRRSVVRALDASLARLGTDYIDLFYLHQPDDSTPIDETLATLEDLVTQGKVRYPAMSNFAAWQLAQAREISTRHGYQPIHVSQVMANMITRPLEDEYTAFAKAYDISSIVYNPLAGGLLTGKYRRTEEVAEGRFTNPMYRDRYWTDRQFDAVEEAAAVAATAGISLVELSLRWALSQDYVSAVLLGASTVDQLTQNLASVAGGALGDETLRAADAVWQNLRGPIPRYNR